MRRLWFPAFALISLAFLSSALADDNNTVEARRLFEQGNQQLDRGEYVEALGSFEKAYAQWNNPKILLNIATTLRQLGRSVQAADAYERYLADPASDPAKRPQVLSVLREIDSRTAQVQLENLPAGATARLDGRPIQSSSAWIRLEPGSHTLLVEKTGTTPVVQHLNLALGERKTLSPAFPTDAAPSTPKPPTPATTQTPAAPAPIQAPAVRADRPTIGAQTFVDVDGKFRGVVAGLGLHYHISDYFVFQLSGLIGKDKGLEPAASLFLLAGSLKPLIYLGIPAFFVDGTRVGLHPALGLQLDASSRWSFSAKLGASTFFNAPQNYDKTYVLATVGTQVSF